MINALSLLARAPYSESKDGEFSAPSIMEFYPEAIFFAGTPFELNRIMLIRLLVMTALVVLFWLWTSKFKKAYKENILVPSRFQLMGEISLNFVRKSIAHEQLGEKTVIASCRFSRQSSLSRSA